MKNALKEVRKNEEGFTLVELIVVIVIIAIMAAASIGGIYKYVNQSRENTDIANAEAIQSTLATIGTEEAIYRNAKVVGATTPTTLLSADWTDRTDITTSSITFASGVSDADKTEIISILNSLLTDGLTESKTGDGFTLTVTALDKLGNIKVTCVCN